jgi:hypothetical protein
MKKLTNKVVLVVDASGSMHSAGLASSVVELINSTIQTLKENAKQTKRIVRQRDIRETLLQIC